MEKHIERYVRKQIEQMGGRCLKWVCPGNVGVPDRIILLPHRTIYFIEFKDTSYKPTALQEWWGDELRRMGFKWRIIQGMDEAHAFIAMLKGEVMPGAV